MHPSKVDRSRLEKLTDLPNVGPALAEDLRDIGIREPGDLAGKDPLKLYQKLCRKRGRRQDPCVLDVFLSLTRFLAGDPPKVWWEYTEERKRTYGEALARTVGRRSAR